MSPIRDPDSPSARRLTQLGARMAAKEGSSARPAHGRDREALRDGEADRPRLDPERAVEGELDDLPTRQKYRRRSTAARPPRVAAKPDESGETGSLPVAGATTPLRGLVVATTRGPCEVELDDGSLVLGHLPKALVRSGRSLVAVGDRVRLGARPSGELAIDLVEPRRSKLSRPDPSQPHLERVLAANVDLAVIVVSLRNPPLVPGLIDRFLVALRHGGVEVSIAVNKIDLVSSERARAHESASLAALSDLGVAVVRCSAQTGSGLETLRSLIANKTVVFVGHSGVGKSSLLNALVPEADARVGVLAANQRRGRHTTSRARIYRLADGTRIVDTPGIREFGLWQMSAPELAGYFDDFEPFAADCHFSDCSHSHEPVCAVRAAVGRGELPADRLAVYLRIYASLELA